MAASATRSPHPMPILDRLRIVLPIPIPTSTIVSPEMKASHDPLSPPTRGELRQDIEGTATANKRVCAWRYFIACTSSRHEAKEPTIHNPIDADGPGSFVSTEGRARQPGHPRNRDPPAPAPTRVGCRRDWQGGPQRPHSELAGKPGIQHRSGRAGSRMLTRFLRSPAAAPPPKLGFRIATSSKVDYAPPETL